MCEGLLPCGLCPRRRRVRRAHGRRQRARERTLENVCFATSSYWVKGATGNVVAPTFLHFGGSLGGKEGASVVGWFLPSVHESSMLGAIFKCLAPLMRAPRAWLTAMNRRIGRCNCWPVTASVYTSVSSLNEETGSLVARKCVGGIGDHFC